MIPLARAALLCFALLKKNMSDRKSFSKTFVAKEFGFTVSQPSGPCEPSGRGFYEPETADDFFSELQAALDLAPCYRKMYGAFGRTFKKLLNSQTQFERMTFGGDFAKADYLLKEHHAKEPMVRAVNAVRVRIRQSAQLSEGELSAAHLDDLRTLCEFTALLLSADVPQQLRALFPKRRRAARHRELMGDCVRIIVNSWDDTCIMANAAQGFEGEMRVNYAAPNQAYPYDWTYIRDMLYAGAQLNLVRPRMSEGVVYPELIIFEPDYLVDVSSIARCFENYAESPYVNLLKKLQGSAPTQPIVLGNFMGQILDETVQSATASRTYAESIGDFFRKNALALLTADIQPDFHSEAQRQKQNIVCAMRTQLPQAVSTVDPEGGFVEPTFFSEMLGVQGRMDYIQLDQGVVIEMKSGKGEFPYDSFNVPRAKEEHYVQLLMYYLIFRYNFSRTYEQNNRHVSTFLLYSKYRESLLALGSSPELIFRAIKVRNGIAWTEQMLATADGYKILEHLTADDLNLKHADNRLWTAYQRPQIESVLGAIRHASPLERAYYFRFLTFIANEHLLSKYGNKTKENSGFAAKWHDTLDEKLEAGNIYDRLHLVSPTADAQGSVESVELEFSETEEGDMANFRKGDIVLLYPYDAGTEPDVRQNMAFRCTISDISLTSITLRLRNPQGKADIFVRDAHRPWAIEHDFIEASFSSLYRGMQSFLSAPQERRDLLLLQRSPETDTSIRLKGDYGTFNELMLRCKQARDFFLIIGPPGTGKTSFGMLNTLREELLEEGAQVLVLSYTNRAVDEICSKLVACGIDFLRLGSALSCDEPYLPYLLEQRAAGCTRLSDVRALIQGTRVMVGTTTAFNSNVHIFGLKQFTLAIIDEASQILEPHLIGLLSATADGRPAIRKFVMIGDYKQLPAVVQQDAATSAVHDEALNGILLTDCRLSMFERLLKRYHDDPAVRFMLCRQGRMHPGIADFPNLAFYNDNLRPVPLGHQTQSLPVDVSSTNGIERMLLTRRTAFVSTAAPADEGSDKVNLVEAEMIAATVVCIHRIEGSRFSTAESVGVIVPYRHQTAAIRNSIDKYGIPELHNVTIDTVERFQGSQRRYIIYGFTVRKYYQLQFLTNNTFEDIDGTIVDRKLNVAMTRAEEHLILFGNAALLSRNKVFGELMDYMRRRGDFFSVAQSDYVAGNFDVPATGEEEQ